MCLRVCVCVCMCVFVLSLSMFRYDNHAQLLSCDGVNEDMKVLARTERMFRLGTVQNEIEGGNLLSQV